MESRRNELLCSVQIYWIIEDLARAGQGLVGSFFWSASGSTYVGGEDAYSVQLGGATLGGPETALKAVAGVNLQSSSAEASATLIPRPLATIEETIVPSSDAESPGEERCMSATSRDLDVVRVVQQHAASMKSITSGWMHECPMM